MVIIIAQNEEIIVKRSKRYRRHGGWVRGHWRKTTKYFRNKKYKRRLPSKRKRKPKTKRTKSVQTRFGKPRTTPARRSIKKK